MKHEFFLTFPTMPKGTAQEKGYNRKTGRYFKKGNVANAEREFRIALRPYIPDKPSDKPIRLFVWFAFDVKNKKLWGKVKPTKPDTDNYLKLFKDCMTADKKGKNGFWIDDAQVVDERVFKTYAQEARIFVSWEEVEEFEL